VKLTKSKMNQLLRLFYRVKDLSFRPGLHKARYLEKLISPPEKGVIFGRMIKPCKPIRIDKKEPKTLFFPVDTATHNRRYQKSPLWPEYFRNDHFL